MFDNDDLKHADLGPKLPFGNLGATMKMRGFGSRQDSKVSQFLPDFMIAPKGFERGPEPPKVAVIV